MCPRGEKRNETRQPLRRFRAKKLFEHELEAWCTDPGKWPTVRNYKAFTEWFLVEVSHMVYDLAPDPIVYNWLI
jgi:hypothetical protein